MQLPGFAASRCAKLLRLAGLGDFCGGLAPAAAKGFQIPGRGNRLRSDETAGKPHFASFRGRFPVVPGIGIAPQRSGLRECPRLCRAWRNGSSHRPFGRAGASPPPMARQRVTPVSGAEHGDIARRSCSFPLPDHRCRTYRSSGGAPDQNRGLQRQPCPLLDGTVGAPLAPPACTRSIARSPEWIWSRAAPRASSRRVLRRAGCRRCGVRRARRPMRGDLARLSR